MQTILFHSSAAPWVTANLSILDVVPINERVNI